MTPDVDELLEKKPQEAFKEVLEKIEIKGCKKWHSCNYYPNCWERKCIEG